MGKRYYCDFCDRSFPDTADNRKKHLNGVHHQKLKKLHYDNYRDAATILAEELTKKPCKRFLQSADCDFGSSCRFSHLTPDEIARLQTEAEEDRIKHHHKKLPHGADFPSLEIWLEKRTKHLASSKTDGIKTTPETKVIDPQMTWKLPPELDKIQNLPPSVLPPCVDDFFVPENINSWG